MEDWVGWDYFFGFCVIPLTVIFTILFTRAMDRLVRYWESEDRRTTLRAPPPPFPPEETTEQEPPPFPTDFETAKTIEFVAVKDDLEKSKKKD